MAYKFTNSENSPLSQFESLFFVPIFNMCVVFALVLFFDRSRDMRFLTTWYLRPVKPQISLRIRAV